MIEASITDVDLLRSIDPADLATYLRSLGWEAQDVPGGGLWSLNSEQTSAQLLVPASGSMRGYVGFMRDALSTLSDVEHRAQLEILEQVRAASKDVQYIRTMPTTESGTIPISDGVKAFDSLKNWVLSAAVSVAGNRQYAVQPRRKPNQALDFLRTVRLGATYPGSFVFSIQISVPPELPGRYLALDHPALRVRRDPFERLVSLRLRDASSAAFVAANRMLSSNGDFESFVEAVPKGVSANLCESLAGLGGEEGYPFSIDFRWAVSRPVEPGERLDFNPGHIRILREAARMLRDTEPEEDVHLVGSVVRLHREGNLGPGEINVLGVIEGDSEEKMVRVWLNLDEDSYRFATIAHEQGATVSVRGTLVRHGNRSSMQGSHTFDVLPELPM